MLHYTKAIETAVTLMEGYFIEQFNKLVFYY